MFTSNQLETVFVVTAFLIQVVLILHFALRKWRFDAAAGGVEGIARCMDCAEDGCQLLPGEILVTVTTNVGTPLSHAAIVAREMSIPAVAGCANATTLLKTRDKVRVDGGRAIVEVLRI